MINRRHGPELESLVASVTRGPGQTPADLRRVAADRAAAVAVGTKDPAPSSLPDDLAALIDKAARHAYTITDADLATLKRSGYSDDQLFEIVIAVAVGAAVGRLDIGLQALRGAQP
jgi:alkylhydroperoxidase family enzyme